jgi:CubicO group peptidase (beta-lactamase class C family)
MRHMRVALLTFVFAVAASALGADYSAQMAAFREFVTAEMAAQKMTGLSWSVKLGDFQWTDAAGFADLENGVAAKKDSSYRMASVTKPMTAVAILKLADEGKIDLDAEVQTYVPSFPRKTHPVTVRQLLAHQGGISHYRNYQMEGRIREPKNTRESLAIFESFDLVNEPGTAFHYSSYGYNLLGAVVESASGKSYGAYLAENVWKPLGMTSTRMDDPRDLIPNRVTGYTLERGKVRRSEYVDISSRFGGGGTRSTVEDMIRFVEGLADGKVLRPATLEQAWTAQKTRNGRVTRYGLGFGIVAGNGRWGVAHGGSQQETRTAVSLLPKKRFAIALASNFEDADLDVFEEKLFELFLGDPTFVAARSNDDGLTNLWLALSGAYEHGLAYYDRHGQAATTDARELTAAFRWLDGMARPKAPDVEDGRDALVRVGSYMAATLAKNGDLEVYHREGPLRFFADYARVAKAHRLEKPFAARVNQWSAEWKPVRVRLSSPGGLDELEKHRDVLAAATIKPDYARQLISLAESHAMSGDIPTALRAANLGYAIYPRSPGLNGVLGVLSLLTGDAPRAETLLATSVKLDPTGYAGAANLLNIANVLANGPTKPAAIALLDAATRLHPSDPSIRTRLAELKK